MVGLTQEEIVQAQVRIDAMPAGIYTVKKIYGSSWPSISNPTDFGTKFKVTVDAGDQLKRIQWHSRRSDNSQDYEIFK